jgi:hypothetical protein
VTAGRVGPTAQLYSVQAATPKAKVLGKQAFCHLKSSAPEGTDQNRTFVKNHNFTQGTVQCPHWAEVTK